MRPIYVTKRHQKLTYTYEKETHQMKPIYVTKRHAKETVYVTERPPTETNKTHQSERHKWGGNAL